MGGRGSGRRGDGWRNFTGNSLPLDIRSLHRKGLLVPGGTFKSRWWRGESEGNSISGFVIGGSREADGSQRAAYLTLLYRYREEEVNQKVPVVWTACTKGGKRAWMICPCCKNGAACGRRVAVLYGAGKVFACRHCYELPYASQYEPESDRLLSKAFKIRERLGQKDGGIMEDYPKKPKGMHWRTYWRLCNHGRNAETLQWGMIACRYGFGKEE